MLVARYALSLGTEALHVTSCSGRNRTKRSCQPAVVQSWAGILDVRVNSVQNWLVMSTSDKPEQMTGNKFEHQA